VPKAATTTTTTSEVDSVPKPGRGAPTDDQLRALGRSTPPRSGGSSSSSAPAALAAGLVLLVLVAWLAVVLTVPAFRRRRRRRAAQTPSAQVQLAWEEANEPVDWITGIRPNPWESHAEFATRLAPSLGDLGPPHRELAELATTASWSAGVTPPADADRARIAARTVADGARRQLTFRQWARLRFSLRRALRTG
jgi:hypothetical protein